MKHSRALLLLLAILAPRCVSITQIEQKEVDTVIVLGITARFHSMGLASFYADSVCVDLSDELDLTAELADHGIDIAQVASITLRGAAYRITRPDPSGYLRLEDGQAAVRRQGEAQQMLVEDLNVPLGMQTDHVTLPLDEAGVAVLNAVLDELLQSTRGGLLLEGDGLCFRAQGLLVPACVVVDVEWDIRLWVNVVAAVS